MKTNRIALISEQHDVTRAAIILAATSLGLIPVEVERIPYRRAELDALAEIHDGKIEVMISGMFLPPHLAMANRGTDPITLLVPNCGIALQDRTDIDDTRENMTYQVVRASRTMPMGTALKTTAAFYNKQSQTITIGPIPRPAMETATEDATSEVGSIPTEAPITSTDEEEVTAGPSDDDIPF